MWLVAASCVFLSGTIGGCNRGGIDAAELGRMTEMPGTSFSGPLPPLSPEEAEVARNLRAHVEMLAGRIGERHVFEYEGLTRAAEYITNALESYGYRVERQPYAVRGRSREVANLIVELSGTSAAGEVLVVGAHYDSVPGCPAANDNGSGVAGTLELARLMAGQRPARTVRFVFFVNEEPPFYHTEEMGSLVYARRCRERAENIVGMISLETIGFYSDAKGSQHYPEPFARLFPSAGNFIGFAGNDASAPFVRDAIGSFRRHTSFPSEGLAADVEAVGRSDNWAFWQAGYPALMVTDTAPFRYPHYHEPSDTPDKIDFDRTARVVMGVTRTVRELAGAE
jgi:hypothetical protein